MEPGLCPRHPGVDERPKLPVVYARNLDRLSQSRQHDAANAGQVALLGADDAGHAPTVRVDHEPLGRGRITAGHVLEPSLEGARVRASGGQLRAGWRRSEPWRHGGAAVFAATEFAKQGSVGTAVLKKGPSAASWSRGESVEVSWGIRANHGGGCESVSQLPPPFAPIRFLPQGATLCPLCARSGPVDLTLRHCAESATP
jgi:hypothetical protein